MISTGNHEVCSSLRLGLDRVIPGGGNTVIVSPFITESGVDNLFSRLYDFSDVQVITDLSPENFVQGASDTGAITRLLEGGASVGHHQDLHAKVYGRKDGWYLVTSANLTHGGLDRNLEMGITVKSSVAPGIEAWLQDLYGKTVWVDKKGWAERLHVIDALCEEHRRKAQSWILSRKGGIAYFKIRGIARSIPINIVEHLPIEHKPRDRERLGSAYLNVVNEKDVPDLQSLVERLRRVFAKITVDDTVFRHLIDRDRIPELRDLAAAARQQLGETLDHKVRPTFPQILTDARNHLDQMIEQIANRIEWTSASEDGAVCWRKRVSESIWSQAPTWDSYRGNVTVNWNVTVPHPDMLADEEQNNALKASHWMGLGDQTRLAL